MTARSRIRLAAGLAAGAVALSGCGLLGTNKQASGGGDKVTITLAGPNQWNTSGSSFGPAWEDLVAAFEAKEPGIDVQTQVLPLNSFAQTISTQLAAGTAPELVFNQPPHKAHEVHALDEELKKPNPYVEGNKAWIDVFRPEYFGPGVQKALNAESGKIEYVPFNLVAIGLFYNKEAFDRAGVKAPLKTWTEFREACGKLRAAGYDPVGIDKGNLNLGWTWESIVTQLTDKYYDAWNSFDATGKPGKSESVTGKSVLKAIKTGALKSTAPEITESLKLLKEFYDCGTKSWSSAADGGAVVNYRDFVGGKAAMAWGTDFAAEALTKDAKFEFATMPFPTIGKDTTPVSSNAPARYGTSIGGTSYMIPSTVTGPKKEAALKFLQFVSSPAVKPWLDATGGIPAIKGIEPPPQTAGMNEGAWARPFRVSSVPLGPPGTPQRDVLDGYLLGRKDLAAQQKDLQASWARTLDTEIKRNGWSKEDWAK